MKDWPCAWPHLHASNDESNEFKLSRGRSLSVWETLLGYTGTTSDDFVISVRMICAADHVWHGQGNIRPSGAVRLAVLDVQNVRTRTWEGRLQSSGFGMVSFESCCLLMLTKILSYYYMWWLVMDEALQLNKALLFSSAQIKPYMVTHVQPNVFFNW